jgi:hypothetical protein
VLGADVYKRASWWFGGLRRGPLVRSMMRKLAARFVGTESKMVLSRTEA